MGGEGSGRPRRHARADDCRVLDVSRLHRLGCLVEGYSGSWTWFREEQERASIGLRTHSGGLRLHYRHGQPAEGSDGEDEGEEIAYDVPLAWVPCTKGGTRPYFLCPRLWSGRPCANRVAKLYLRGRYFLCRHCHDLRYDSQSENEFDRFLRRKERLRLKMGGRPGTTRDPFPQRPKGRWRRLHRQRSEQLIDMEMEAEDRFAALFEARFPGHSLDDLP